MLFFSVSDYSGHTIRQSFGVTGTADDPDTPYNFTQTTDHGGNHERTRIFCINPRSGCFPQGQSASSPANRTQRCTQIASAIYKVAARAELNPRIEEQAPAFFFQASRAEDAMAQSDCRRFPTKRQMGLRYMALRSILTLPTENIPYPISAKSSNTQLVHNSFHNSDHHAAKISSRCEAQGTTAGPNELAFSLRNVDRCLISLHVDLDMCRRAYLMLSFFYVSNLASPLGGSSFPDGLAPGTARMKLVSCQRSIHWI